jgi:hypothetical protein
MPLTRKFGHLTNFLHVLISAGALMNVFQHENAFASANVRGEQWLPHFVYAAFIFTYNEGVKWCAAGAYTRSLFSST